MHDRMHDTRSSQAPTHTFPEMVEWELTRACDLSCAHCYQASSRPRAAELSTSEALEMARRLAELGCRSITLSGGEPTLRPDWSLIAARLSELSVGVQLFSNGQRMDAAAASVWTGSVRPTISCAARREPSISSCAPPVCSASKAWR